MAWDLLLHVTAACGNVGRAAPPHAAAAALRCATYWLLVCGPGLPLKSALTPDKLCVVVGGSKRPERLLLPDLCAGLQQIICTTVGMSRIWL